MEAGEENVITRLVPNTEVVDHAKAYAAFERIRERAKELKFGAFDWESMKADRDEGRP